MAQVQGCVVRTKTRSSPCHRCLHLRISLALTLHLTLTSSSSIRSSRTTSQVTLPINKHCAAPPIEESGPLAETTSSTGYEPNVIDNFDYSETYTEIFLQEQSRDTMPSYLHDGELSDETIGKALSSPLFTQEREEPAGRRQAYHPFEESLLPSQSLSVCHVSTGRPSK